MFIDNSSLNFILNDNQSQVNATLNIQIMDINEYLSLSFKVKNAIQDDKQVINVLISLAQ